jgi:mersacidin/lichenicidin family type 2 lantibiotic
MIRSPAEVQQRGGEKMKVDIARAWKDPEYRKSLTPEQLAGLPPNPAGTPELTDEVLDKTVGGAVGVVGVGETSLLWCPEPTQPSTNCCEVSKDIKCL